MAEIAVAKVESKDLLKRDVYAQVCYHYPQYNLKDVEQMPNRDVALLLKTANRIEGARMLHLTQIAAAPHTEKGSGVKKLTKHFKEVAKNG